jgi:predicted site-specific integrase-resolvase
VLDQPLAQEPTEELIRDMLTIVTVFAGRLYGQRAKGLRSRVQRALKECEQEPEVRDGTGQADH